MSQHKFSFVKVIIFFSSFVLLNGEQADDLKFPDEFSIGVGTSAYQTEGAWNIFDKGESVWDRYVHENPHRIENKSTGDVACDSYNKYKEDIKLIKDIGFNHYRFSISWPRILPTGFANVVSKEGVKHYNDLLEELEKNGIIPFVTIYHWDHPETLQKLGGWTNEIMVDLFGDYARVVFREFGQRVKFFTTINEPLAFCKDGYTTGHLAPGYTLSKTAEYLCVHNTLKAHARAYHIYNEEFRASQGGKIGLAIPCHHHFSTTENDTASEVAFQFECGRFAHPIFSEEGDYPQIVKQLVAERSALEGHTRSRLPSFSKEWIQYIRGTADYFGLNHYTSVIVESKQNQEKEVEDDEGIVYKVDPEWPSAFSPWLKIVPEGLRNVLKQIKERYKNPPVYILENGMSDNGTLVDVQRIEYFYSYIRETLRAIKEDGCNVKSYTIWSLLDNLEWDRGYSERFGIIQVDFNHPNKTRIPKESTKWIKCIIKKRELLSYSLFKSSQ